MGRERRGDGGLGANRGGSPAPCFSPWSKPTPQGLALRGHPLSTTPLDSRGVVSFDLSKEAPHFKIDFFFIEFVYIFFFELH